MGIYQKVSGGSLVNLRVKNRGYFYMFRSKEFGIVSFTVKKVLGL
jgi:hypothetical protein